MNLREVLQAGPAKANEIFARLFATSSGSVKIREKLFDQLKTELELYADLEERHLFPVLRKHQATKDLVFNASNDNKQLRARLAELDTVAKDDEVFIHKLRDLERGFQQSVRDEKKELLPAVLRAVSEQVQVVADRIEAGRAEAKPSSRDRVERQQSEAKREGEQAAQRAADQKAAAQKMVEQARRAAEQARKAAEGARKAAQKKAAEEARKVAEQKAAEQARKAAEQKAAEQARKVAEQKAAEQARNAAEQKAAVQARKAAERAQKAAERAQQVAEQKAAERTGPDFQALSAFSKATTGGMTEIGSAWMDWLGDSTCAGTKLSQRLLGCRTMQDLADTQRSFIASSTQGWMAHNARVMQISHRVAEEALRALGQQSGTQGDPGSDRR